ncbi:MAG: single-stranded DNA-binding protein [Spirochaetaceae bacterium]|nr:MAG: single-stranded DNA-binding protein [Spirochaetaceae bacterium]
MGASSSQSSGSRVAEALVQISAQLRDELDGLRFSPPTEYVYNPLQYAWNAHTEYLKRYASAEKRVVFLGMNPGPWGMAQTGIPFGEVSFARDWIQSPAPAGRPGKEHPKRPVLGFECGRSEPSGKRLWGLMQQRFGTAEQFFTEHFVLNYCPLLFLEASGRNRTPDKLPKSESLPLSSACDNALGAMLAVLRPQYLVGIGRYAEAALKRVVNARPDLLGLEAHISGILHPSPANPRANAGWDEAAIAGLKQAGVW